MIHERPMAANEMHPDGVQNQKQATRSPNVLGYSWPRNKPAKVEKYAAGGAKHLKFRKVGMAVVPALKALRGTSVLFADRYSARSSDYAYTLPQITPTRCIKRSKAGRELGTW